MRDGHVFGYGSLVNTGTHRYPVAPATLPGWRRVWVHRPGAARAILSVAPADGSVIDGVVAAVAAADWPALDLREASYGRTPLEIGAVARHPVEIYRLRPGAEGPPLPILASYLDCVLQGFLRLFGPAGLTRFMATTDGWSTILDDRAAPLYPRHQRLDATERGAVEAALNARSADAGGAA